MMQKQRKRDIEIQKRESDVVIEKERCRDRERESDGEIQKERCRDRERESD